MIASRKPAMRRRGGLIGQFPSIKMNHQVWWEYSLEHDYCYLLEFDTEILEYASQCAVEIDHLSTPRVFYPDFRVTTRFGVEYREVKGKWLQDKPDFQARWQDRVSALASRGQQLRLVTEKAIRADPRLPAFKELWRHARLGATASEVERLGNSIGDCTSVLSTLTSEFPIPDLLRIAGVALAKRRIEFHVSARDLLTSSIRLLKE